MAMSELTPTTHRLHPRYSTLTVDKNFRPSDAPWGELWLPEWFHEFLDERGRAPDDWREVDQGDCGLAFYEAPADPLPFPDPSNHRDALVFETELGDMTAAARQLLRAHFDADVLLEEFPYGSETYRTDIVCCVVDDSALDRRLRMTGSADTLTSRAWKFLNAYWWLGHHQPVTDTGFIETGPYVEKSNREILDWLDEHNLLARSRRGYIVRVDIPYCVTAHAVELKPRDWETALEQAARAHNPRPSMSSNKYGYADYRWVCLDAGQAHKALAERDRFGDAGVGLLSIDRGGLLVLVEAEAVDPPAESRDRLHVNERALRHLDDVDERLAEQKPLAGNEQPDRQTGLAAFNGGNT